MRRELIDTGHLNEMSPVIHGFLFQSAHANDALGIRLETKNHGGQSIFVSYEMLAALLDTDDLSRIRTTIVRQRRHSGVDSLDEIGSADLDDYKEVDR